MFKRRNLTVFTTRETNTIHIGRLKWDGRIGWHSEDQTIQAIAAVAVHLDQARRKAGQEAFTIQLDEGKLTWQRTDWSKEERPGLKPLGPIHPNCRCAVKPQSLAEMVNAPFHPGTHDLETGDPLDGNTHHMTPPGAGITGTAIDTGMPEGPRPLKPHGFDDTNPYLPPEYTQQLQELKVAPEDTTAAAMDRMARIMTRMENLLRALVVGESTEEDDTDAGAGDVDEPRAQEDEDAVPMTQEQHAELKRRVQDTIDQFIAETSSQRATANAKGGLPV